jgi:putative endonuclease
MTEDINSAIEREKQFKNWHRDWKINLINSFNPTWKDLSLDLGL